MFPSLQDFVVQLKEKHLTDNYILFYPNVQLMINWNCNIIMIKSEADIINLKSYCHISRINMY